MADEIYISGAAKVVFVNPDDTDQVRQLSGVGSPQWVNLASSPTFSECALTLAQKGTSGVYYGDMPAGLTASRRYQYLLYASSASAFSDSAIISEYEPENAPVNVTQLGGTTQTAADVGANSTDIKAKTDNLPTDPADASDIVAAFGTVNTTLGVLAGYIDTEIGAIKAKTDLLTTFPDNFELLVINGDGEIPSSNDGLTSDQNTKLTQIHTLIQAKARN
jgi:hypothetical protein